MPNHLVCPSCNDASECRSSGACLRDWRGVLALQPGTRAHADKVAHRAMTDAQRDEPPKSPCALDPAVGAWGPPWRGYAPTP